MFVSLVAPAAQAQQQIEWRHYAADRASSKYSPADQIDASNIEQLDLAWSWDTPDAKIDTKERSGDFEGTPLMADGVLYAVTSYNLVAALDPSTGEQLWTFDPRAYDVASPPHGGLFHRGIELWQHEETKRQILGPTLNSWSRSTR